MSDFTFETSQCPECGAPPSHIVEKVLGGARLSQNADGSFDYAGYTDVDWDTQETFYTDSGKAILVCDNRHQWTSKLLHKGLTDSWDSNIENDPPEEELPQGLRFVKTGED